MQIATSISYRKIHDLIFTQNFAQYSLHHVTYAPAKFEVPTLNGLIRRDVHVFTRKYII